MVLIGSLETMSMAIEGRSRTETLVICVSSSCFFWFCPSSSSSILIERVTFAAVVLLLLKLLMVNSYVCRTNNWSQWGKTKNQRYKTFLCVNGEIEIPSEYQLYVFPQLILNCWLYFSSFNTKEDGDSCFLSHARKRQLAACMLS